MKELMMYRCEICGNLLVMVEDSGMVPVCCGKKMDSLIANTTDGAHEKHVPVINRNGNTLNVLVGEVPHPMTQAHHITWIAVLTDRGLYSKALDQGRPAAADFLISPDEELTAVYAYCNLHGLWCRKE